MAKPRIFIGPFKRRVFSDGLRALLDSEGEFAVSELPSATDVERYLAADTPTILILEHEEDCGPYPLPASSNVGVILIAQEGADIQIALRQLDKRRLRAAIGLVEQADHPKVVSFAANSDAQPPCILPQFREAGQSVLVPLIAWLDATFQIELRRISEHAAGDEGSWSAELQRLIERHAVDEDASADALFERLLDTPVWQRRLSGVLALDEVEVKSICLAAAPDVDQKYCRTIGFLQGDYNATRPNASTLARLLRSDLAGGDFDAFCASSRLFSRFKLVRRAETEKPGAAQPGLCVAPSLLDFVLSIRPRAGPGWIIQDQALPGAPEIIEAVTGVFADGSGTPMLCLPSDTRDAVDECCAALVAQDHTPFRFDAATLTEVADPQSTLRDQALRAGVESAVLVIERLNVISDNLFRLVLDTDLGGPSKGIVYAGRLGTPRTEGNARAIRIAAPDAELRRKRWRAAAAQQGLALSTEDAGRLSSRLRFSLADISATARLAAGDNAPSDTPVLQRLLGAARDVSARHAPHAVRRPPCTFTWDDIVLPEEIEADVRAISAHVANSGRVLDDWKFKTRLSYGRGVGALFSGYSGTGKTMTAQVIAADLGVDLMQVELSRCVSKYIGETEKNIDACFTAAEAASAVLLFDEADALFGKRTEIKDAHDRHANVETAYLLQRIEAYEGLVILTTNLKANIDAAFLRRLRFVIDYRMPGCDDRKKIWKRAFPKGVPFAKDVDVEFLARRLQLSGGSIQQIAVNAAFVAAADGDEIAMRHIMAATRSELRKMGMLSAERELRDPAPVLQVEGAVVP